MAGQKRRIRLLAVESKPRLAVVSTHPIQYNAPLFRELASRGRVVPKVFYTWDPDTTGRFDREFGQAITWDLPLLEGYDHAFPENRSRCPGSHRYSGIINPTLERDILDWKPDAVLVYGWKFQSHLTLMRRLNGRVPVWFRGDSHLLDEQGGLRTWGRRLCLKWVYRHVDHAFYCGQHNRAYFKAHNLRDDQLSFMPHAVDNGRFGGNDSELQEQAAATRNATGFDDDRIVVAFVGKFIRKKNPLLLIEAAQLLDREECRHLQLLFVGAGELEQELHATIPVLADIKIRMLPFQNQSSLPMIYRIGDLLALPSQGPGETWGLAVNEAMASGRGVIVSDKVGCSPDLVEEGVTGFGFEHGRADRLAEVLRRVITLRRAGLLELGKVAQTHIGDWSHTTASRILEEKLCLSEN